MPRPSVAGERREQIIEATFRTIAEHGISGTTLDRIANAAGMSRGHVRHFAGNREAILVDAARAFYARGDDVAILPPSITTLDAALDFLFGPDFVASTAENAVVLGFVELSRTMPEIATVLTDAYLGVERRLGELIASARPAAPLQKRSDAAVSVLTAALGAVFIEEFSHDPHRAVRARRAAEALIATL